MRAIERKMIEAIKAGKDWHSGNTAVHMVPDLGYIVTLHSNNIAVFRNKDRVLGITLAGWPTPTTRSRINAVLFGLATGAVVYRKNGRSMVSGDGVACTFAREMGSHEWVEVKVP